jgi:hypothetical protein
MKDKVELLYFIREKLEEINEVINNSEFSEDVACLNMYVYVNDDGSADCISQIAVEDQEELEQMVAMVLLSYDKHEEKEPGDSSSINYWLGKGDQDLN